MHPLLLSLSLVLPAHAQQPVVLQRAALARLQAAIPPQSALHRITASRDTTLTLSGGPVVVRPGDVLAFKAAPTPAAAASPLTALRMVSVNATGTVRIAALAFAAEGGGLRYDPVTDEFRGTLDVWLEDVESGAAGYALPQPVSINVFSEADSLSDGLVRFTNTDAPQRLSLVVRAPGDSVWIQFWPLARIDSVTAAVRVLPALRVQVTPARVAAWGLETAVATVELLGDAHGEFGVTVRPTRADPQTLQFTHREAKSAVLRSRGLGPDTVRVSGAGLAPALAVVTYAFPFALLVALTLGSAVGTTALQLGAKTHAAGPVWAFGRGLLLGVVAVAAYAVGVKAIPVPIPAQVGEGGAFVVSAFAAYLGLRKR